MPNLVCVCCKKSFEDHKVVTCCVCKNNYSNICVELTPSETRLIKSKKNFSWTCQNCSQLGDNINDLKFIILSLQKEVESLKSLRNQPTAASNNVDYEEIIQEITERNLRKRNLVVFGVAEINSNAKEERAQHDEHKLTEILKYLSPNFTTDNMKPVRLGKYDATKNNPRPIKISLRDEATVHNFIRKAKTLRDRETFKNVNISLDRTPRQIEYYRTVKNELIQRSSEGETNLQIKYVRGIPKIVSVN